MTSSVASCCPWPARSWCRGLQAAMEDLAGSPDRCRPQPGSLSARSRGVHLAHQGSPHRGNIPTSPQHKLMSNPAAFPEAFALKALGAADTVLSALRTARGANNG